MPAKVFYSYAHEDEELRNKLETHLAILRRNGVISEWHDRKIQAGTRWAQAIDHHVDTSNLILLLISPDFLASDYCHDIEMSRALARHSAGEATVIPVILRPVDWHGAPFSTLQALPRDAKPITTWSNLDEAFADVAAGIRKVLDTLPAHPSGEQCLSSKSTIEQVRVLQGAAPTRIPVGHSRVVIGKIAIPGSDALRSELDADDTYGLESANVKDQEFTIAFSVVMDTPLPVNALVRLKSPDFEPGQQEIQVALDPRADSMNMPFHIKAGQSGSKFITLEILVENRFVVSRALRTRADDDPPPGFGGIVPAAPPTPADWTVVAMLALTVLAQAQAQHYASGSA